jgi:hypothetical protein
MSINNEIDKLESDFFRIVFDIKFNSDAKKWMGKIRIQRKDTDEIVKGGFRVFDEDKSLLEKKLFLVPKLCLGMPTVQAQLDISVDFGTLKTDWSKPMLSLIQCITPSPMTA